MTRLTAPLALAVLALAACSTPDTLVTLPETPVSQHISSRYSSVEVVQVSLPTYASNDTVAVERGDGTLQTTGLLWADDPTRSMTLVLARHLAEITGARVAPDPWPFEPAPAVRVDVRVERMLTDDSGAFVLSGQYFIAPTGAGSDRARLFRITVPAPADGASVPPVQTRARAIADLALDIARNGLR